MIFQNKINQSYPQKLACETLMWNFILSLSKIFLLWRVSLSVCCLIVSMSYSWMLVLLLVQQQQSRLNTGRPKKRNTDKQRLENIREKKKNLRNNFSKICEHFRKNLCVNISWKFLRKPFSEFSGKNRKISTKAFTKPSRHFRYLLRNFWSS